MPKTTHDLGLKTSIQTFDAFVRCTLMRNQPWPHFQSGIRERSVKAKGVRLQLHGAIYRPDSFVMMLCYCANLKAIRYESTSLNRIVSDKSHRVIVA